MTRVKARWRSAGAGNTASSYFGIKWGLYPVPTYTGGMAITTWLPRAATIVIVAAGPVIAVSQLSRGLTHEIARSEAAGEAKSGFLAMMSHELRTPMTAVIGTAMVADKKDRDNLIAYFQSLPKPKP